MTTMLEFLSSIFGTSGRYEIVMIIAGCVLAIVSFDLIFNFLLGAILNLFKGGR